MLAEIKSWTGFGGNANWADPLNWTGNSVPGLTDDVWLDNSETPLSYQVILPDTLVIIRTLHIHPSPGCSIELLLPASNKMLNAFTVTGPGYGIELFAGAVFRNASGISSGESLSISDSLIIHDGARYIHQTRASHANGILRLLSMAPGTEQGIFDFNVPRASYTVSVSNRVYGCLEFHATALGSAVNYTCSGANPLTVRGNLRVGTAVNVSVNLSGSNGNIQVAGDFVQEGGQLNLAAGTGNQTVLRIKGNLYQSPSAVITETTNGNPYLELNGNNKQGIAMTGLIRNRVGFRLNNAYGAELHSPLELPSSLDLVEGVLGSSDTAMLTLDSGCLISADSSRLSGTYIEGPLRKLGLSMGEHFLFPVGKAGYLRWLILHNVSGDFTVEYFRNDPATFGANLAPGLNHISKIEYWTIHADSSDNQNAVVELSFASVQCGGVTDPQYLNVAKFVGAFWNDAGHSAITGNAVQGSVSSGPDDCTADAYTLASTVNLENPLPLTTINLKIKKLTQKLLFNWSYEGPVVPDHFELVELGDTVSKCIMEVDAMPFQSNYEWVCSSELTIGSHYFRIDMIDGHGLRFNSNVAVVSIQDEGIILRWIGKSVGGGGNQLLVISNFPDKWSYEILSITGNRVAKGKIQLTEGNNLIRVQENLRTGFYVFHAVSSNGKTYSLLIIKEPG
jgi:hypothetical protein